MALSYVKNLLPPPPQSPPAPRVEMNWSRAHVLVGRYLSAEVMSCNYTPEPRSGVANIAFSSTELAAMKAREESLLAPLRTQKGLICDTAPALPIATYLLRVLGMMRCSKECLVFAVALVKRVAARGFPITPRTVHRVLLSCLVLAAKNRDDYYRSMHSYAKAGGLFLRDMLASEARCFALLDYDCGVARHEYYCTEALLMA